MQKKYIGKKERIWKEKKDERIQNNGIKERMKRKEYRERRN